MSNLVAVRLQIVPEKEIPGIYLPLGVVAGIEVAGVGCSKTFMQYADNIEVNLTMGVSIARRVLGSFARHQSHKSFEALLEHRRRCGNNALTFLAEASGRPVTNIDQFLGSLGPELITGRYKEVADSDGLKPDSFYGVMDSRGRLMHGGLATSEVGQVLTVNGSTSSGNALMYLADVSDLLDLKLFNEPTLVELNGQAYEPGDAELVSLCDSNE